MLDLVASGQISDLVMEYSPAAIAVFDLEMRYIAHNRRWLEDYELGDRMIIGLQHPEVFPDIPEMWQIAHRRVLGGESLSGDAEAYMHADGSVSWIDWRMVPWRGRTGEVGGTILFTQKLNELFIAQQLETSYHAALDLMIDSATDYAIAMLNPIGVVSFWSAGAERIFGWSCAEMLGKPIKAIFPAEELAIDSLPGLFRMAAQNGVHRQRCERVKKDGARFMVDANLSPIRDKAGRIIGFASVMRDITRELEREHALAAGEAQMRAILETVPDAMVMVDENGTIESFSATAEALFGYSSDEVVGRNAGMLTPAQADLGCPEVTSAWASPGSGRVVNGMQRQVGRCKDGTMFPYELCVGEATSNGRRIFIGFIRDLSLRDRAESQLREVQAELSQKSRITAVQIMATALAHEINQPLTAVANYMQAAASLATPARNEDSDMVRHALAEAGREAIRAGEIIRRLREFVAQGELKCEAVRVDDLVSQACSLGFVGCDSGNIMRRVEVDPWIDLLVIDSIQIQQVLINLIRNAVQAVGPAGRIMVRACAEDAWVRFSVIDNGPGVPPERLESIFDPFVTLKKRGMGLGLAICRTIVELHGGRLWHEPAQGGGATFHFTIPKVEAPDA